MTIAKGHISQREMTMHNLFPMKGNNLDYVLEFITFVYVVNLYSF